MNTALAPSPHSTEWSFPIEGMTCSSCVARVEKALAKLPGASFSSVNFATDTAMLRATANLPLRAITEAVERAGYTVPQ